VAVSASPLPLDEVRGDRRRLAEVVQPEAAWDVSILSFLARVSGPPDLVAEARRLFPLARPSVAESAAVSARFQVSDDPLRPDRYRIERDGTTYWATDRRDEITPGLASIISAAAVEQLGERYLLLHAGSVARNGHGMLLPAASGSGKSTLAAGLAASGFQYFGDDVAAIETASSRLVPFAQSICVKAGSRAALAGLYPQLGAEPPFRRWGRDSVWYLAPPAPSRPTGGAPVRFVVLPRYVSTGETVLEPIARSAALVALLEQSFSVRRLGASGVQAVVALVAGTDCYRLTVGDLPHAVALLTDLAESHPPALDR
jgi:hypothetical protein